MTSLVREDPPPTGRYDWAAFVRQVRADPGEWYKIFDDGPVTTVNAIRQGEISTLTPYHRPGQPGAGFEVTTRNNRLGPPRTCTLYLRWFPGEENDSAATTTD